MVIMDMGAEEVNYTLRGKWHNREPHPGRPAGMAHCGRASFGRFTSRAMGLAHSLETGNLDVSQNGELIIEKGLRSSISQSGTSTLPMMKDGIDHGWVRIGTAKAGS